MFLSCEEMREKKKGNAKVSHKRLTDIVLNIFFAMMFVLFISKCIKEQDKWTLLILKADMSFNF